MSTQSSGSTNTRNWVIRLVSLYIFSFVAFLLMGLIMPAFRIGFWHTFWAALIFTLATVFVKPIVSSFAQKTADGLKQGKTSTVGRIIEYVAVYIVAVVIWIIVTMLTSLHSTGFWSFLIAPLFLWVAWIVYDIVDESIERTVAKGYDAAARKLDGGNS